MPKPKSTLVNEKMRALKQSAGINPETAPVMNPTKASEGENLPKDAVALLVWRKFTGPQPMTIVVTRNSWEMNKKVVMDAGFQFVPERIYEFDSPTNPKGRKTTFMFQDVIGWAANVDTGIIAAPPGLKV
jgi:hypothetical protein